MFIRPSYVTILIGVTRAYVDLSWAVNDIKCEVAREGSLNPNPKKVHMKEGGIMDTAVETDLKTLATLATFF